MVEMITMNGREVVQDFELVEVPISKIKFGDRVRSDYGDIKSLADSIKSIGLLVPVAISPDNELICGGRRIKAFERLKRKKVPCVVIHSKTDELAIKKAEEAENIERKAFTPSEKLAAYRKIQMLSKVGGKGRGDRSGPTPQWKQAGFSSEDEYKATSAVVNKGGKVGKTIAAAMDAEVFSPRAAQELLQLPDDQILDVIDEYDIPEDPEEMRQNSKRIAEEVKEFKAEQRRKEKERREREAVKLYFEEWNQLLQLAMGIQENHGSIRQMVKESPWNLARNRKHWERFDELLEDFLPMLKKYHRETKEYLNG